MSLALTERVESVIDLWSEPLPLDNPVSVIVKFIHDMGMLFAGVTAPFAADGFCGGEPSAGVKPTDEDAMGSERFGFRGSVNEDRLGYVLCEMSVPVREPQRSGIHELQVPMHEFGKSFI